MQLRSVHFQGPTYDCSFCPEGKTMMASFRLIHNRFDIPICRDCAEDCARGFAELLPRSNSAGVEAVLALERLADRKSGSTPE